MTEGNGAVRADERYEVGQAIRKDVLGEAHVERALAAVSDFSRPVQEFVTRACWGDVWGRPGLDRRTRSLLNLVMLTALGRNHELGVHVRGAITNGCTEQEIQEALLQAAVYCGVPAALESFRVAERVLEEIAADG
jgi:4-carboxymuconolactone decarboxylase